MLTRSMCAAAAAMALSGGALAQPELVVDITTPNNGGIVFAGDTISVLVSTVGVDFDPFTPITSPITDAPQAYNFNILFSGGGTPVPSPAVHLQPRPVFGVGSDPTVPFFGRSSGLLPGNPLGLNVSNIAFVLGQLSPGGLFDDGPLIRFDFVVDQSFAGDITISFEPFADSAGRFVEDIFTYSTDGRISGREQGVGNTILNPVTFTVQPFPAPGVAAAFGAAGLLASRRRRV
ncbi:MAG: hypothetical protein AAGI17_06365 [Planctomycetota bacterium]